jgi:hypothetical protein
MERPVLRVLNNLERRSGLFQQEEMRDAWKGTAYSYAGDARYEEASPSSSAGQKLIREASGQAPTAVQRLALALVSLGMLMGMTILLTIMAAKTSAPGSLCSRCSLWLRSESM